MRTALVCMACAAPGAAAAEAAPRPDLRVIRVSDPPAVLAAAASFRASDTTKNAGRAGAKRSLTRYYLSADRAKGRSDRRLGGRPVAAVARGKSSRGSRRVTVPTISPGLYHVLACADDLRKVTERNEGNNCRASRGRARVAAAVVPTPLAPIGLAPGGGSVVAVDTDGDGFIGDDCAPQDRAVNPGAADPPEASFADTNCDGIDGAAAGAIFVAVSGNDGNDGSRSQPKRTLAAAIPAASSSGKDVYAAGGTYSERLVVANGVAVYGGYQAGDWSRAAANITQITSGGVSDGRVQAAEAISVSATTRLQYLRITATSTTSAGVSVYGLHASSSPGLVLERMTIQAQDAGTGAAGASGAPGVSGDPGGNGGAGSCDGGGVRTGGGGGVSSAGRPGGVGGSGGPEGSNSGTAGGTGVVGTLGGGAGSGGNPGGSGGPGSSGVAGSAGADGSGGTGGSVGSGFWSSASGGDGSLGGHGNGGGGGGGGGGQGGTFVNDGAGNGGGGGGGGGARGGTGTGGGGGGGSFGLFLVNSAGMQLTDSAVSSGLGGPGGRSGAGGSGGAGGGRGFGAAVCTGEVGAGGNGGVGGAGGRGGAGGGGAGGPSFAVHHSGGMPTITSSTLTPGSGGNGGTSAGSSAGSAGASGALGGS